MPNYTSKANGMAGMGQDWWSLGSQLLGGATQLGTQYLQNQQPAPQIIYQQPAQPAPVVVQGTPSTSSNTLLYVALGVVAAGGLAWYFMRKK
jgi:LPXTG-motif cell wall-anchored protein